MLNVGLFIAALMISIAIWQVRYYKNVLAGLRQKDLPRRDFLFQSHQAGRRLQLHGLLGLAGIGMVIGFYIPHIHPLFWTVVWLLVIFFIIWAMLLALVDYFSIKLYYLGMQRKDHIEKIQREYEIKQFIKEQKEKWENNNKEVNNNSDNSNSDNNNSDNGNSDNNSHINNVSKKHIDNHNENDAPQENASEK